MVKAPPDLPEGEELRKILNDKEIITIKQIPFPPPLGELEGAYYYATNKKLIRFC